MSEMHTWRDEHGVWRRNLGCMESFYQMLATPEGTPVHFMIGCCVSIEYTGPEPAAEIGVKVRHAWKQVRDDHPGIGAGVDQATKELVVSFEMSRDAEEQWLQRSFKMHSGLTADELFSSFTSQSEITLHFLEDTKQLLIQAPHSVIDGRGILYLYQALFTALGNQSVSSNASINGSGKYLGNPPNECLNKPFDDWLGLSQVPTEKDVQAAQSLFGRILAQQSPIRLPGIDFSNTPRRPAHSELVFTVSETAAVIDLCKASGFSVTSAWHAALILATKTLQAAAGEVGESFAQITTIDLRKYFAEAIAQNKNFALASLQTALPFALDLSDDSKASFEALAKSLATQYKAPFAFAGNDFNFLTPYTAIAKQIFSSKAAPPSSTPYTSSMGLIDDFLGAKYGEWEIKDFWVSSTMLTGDFQVYLWTFRGAMCISACYNEAYYPETMVQSVLKGTREELLNGLGIKS